MSVSYLTFPCLKPISKFGYFLGYFFFVFQPIFTEQYVKLVIGSRTKPASHLLVSSLLSKQVGKLRPFDVLFVCFFFKIFGGHESFLWGH